jgi:PleD family two-component response regulator
MMEDPRTISSSIDLVFVAKAIERVGDHAKNLAEAGHLRRQGHRRAPHTAADVERAGASRTLNRKEAVMPRVLVVEDEPAIAELVALNLRHSGYDVTRGSSAEAAHAWSTALPDLVVLDWMLPGESGVALARAGAPGAHAACPSSC